MSDWDLDRRDCVGTWASLDSSVADADFSGFGFFESVFAAFLADFFGFAAATSLGGGAEVFGEAGAGSSTVLTSGALYVVSLDLD